MRAPFFFLSALGIIAGCATVPGREGGSVTIAASDIRQVCLQLSADQALDYFFQSSRPVSFEILYNQDGITVYSYSRQNTSSDSGTFYPEKPEFYCMVWKNLNSVPASLKYNYYVQK